MQKIQSEIQLQASCFQKLWNEYPETRYSFFAVPNGGTRNPAEAMQLKASGVVAGVADTILLWNGQAYCIEFKTWTGMVSPHQSKFKAQCLLQGIPYHIVRSEQQFWDIILPIIQHQNKQSA